MNVGTNGAQTGSGLANCITEDARVPCGRRNNMQLCKPDPSAHELASRGAEASPTTPEAFAKYLREDQERWKKVVKTAGIKVN